MRLRETPSVLRDVINRIWPFFNLSARCHTRARSNKEAHLRQ